MRKGRRNKWRVGQPGKQAFRQEKPANGVMQDETMKAVVKLKEKEMKRSFFFLFWMLVCAVAIAGTNPRSYIGSTPAHDLVRNFLQISLTDSIDFVRWKIDISLNTFTLECRYGLAKPGTPGFSNEQKVAFGGQLTQSGYYYMLQHKGKRIVLMEVNANILHFLDNNNHMLSGNGGYSYALNNISPMVVNGSNIRAVQGTIKSPLVFEGRTPCKELSTLLGLSKSEACNKLKWYFLFYTDTVTGKPAYFLMGGMKYRKETMARGTWQIVTEPNGRIIYRVYYDKWARPLDLQKGDERILFFANAEGRLLVGNEDFSYTLNRREEAYSRR
jgi:hypothetical protein